MLVLTRKCEEKIVIGEKNKVTITVLKIQGDKVSIGITTEDPETRIYRKELLEAEQQEKVHVGVGEEIS